MVKDVLDKLDTILDEPGESCYRFIQKALLALEHEENKEAFGYFSEAITNATKGKLYVLNKITNL